MALCGPAFIKPSMNSPGPCRRSVLNCRRYTTPTLMTTPRKWLFIWLFKRIRSPTKKVLYANEHLTQRIVKMSADQSNMPLSRLIRLVTSSRFTVRHHWMPGTVGMRSNRCTQHFVINDFIGERIIEQATVVRDQVATGQPSSYQPHLHAGSLSAAGRHDQQLRHYTGKPAVFINRKSQ